MSKIAGRVCTKCGAVSYCPPDQEREYHQGWAEVTLVVARNGRSDSYIPSPFTTHAVDLCPKCLKPVTDAIGLP